MITMKPFWNYYGGKFRAAPRYPKPIFDRIVEPFAGAAGYSLRYHEREVILIEKYHVVAEIWRFLISASGEEIQKIPLVDAVSDLPAETPDGARWLVGFSLNAATVSPCKNLSAGKRRQRATGRKFEGWTEARRDRVSFQVERIKHWKIVESSYEYAINNTSTWFVDPPYNNKAGSYYVHSDLDYSKLGGWCKQLSGQVIVCENEGANWLDFKPFGTFKAGISANGNTAGSREALYTSVSH